MFNVTETVLKSQPVHWYDNEWLMHILMFNVTETVLKSQPVHLCDNEGLMLSLMFNVTETVLKSQPVHWKILSANMTMFNVKYQLRMIGE